MTVVSSILNKNLGQPVGDNDWLGGASPRVNAAKEFDDVRQDQITLQIGHAMA
jgi:hypothetical protein